MNLEHALHPAGREQVPTTNLSESEYYRLLADERRRRVLDVLADVEAPISIDDLATSVRECETPADENDDANDATDAADDSVLIALHHVHLPMLDDAGVVAYDPTTRDVVSVGRLTG